MRRYQICCRWQLAIGGSLAVAGRLVSRHKRSKELACLQLLRQYLYFCTSKASKLSTYAFLRLRLLCVLAQIIERLQEFRKEKKKKAREKRKKSDIAATYVATGSFGDFSVCVCVRHTTPLP